MNEHISDRLKTPGENNRKTQSDIIDEFFKEVESQMNVRDWINCQSHRVKTWTN